MKRYRLIHQNSNIEAPEGRFDIGRSTECHLVLDDPSVSRVHATIHNDNGRLTIEDRGSRNGVVVNGERIAAPRLLGDGDRIAFGQQTIRVIAIGRPSEADRTMGLATCGSCGAWVSASDERCGKCGAQCGDNASDPRRTAEIQPITQPGIPSPRTDGPHLTMEPRAMVAGLVLKAISMDRHQEAERLLGNLMESAVRRRVSGVDLSADELSSIGSALLTLAVASRSPRPISRLFAFHRDLEMLMPRDIVEALYEHVRKVGYRSCGEMNSYLEFLGARAAGFNPAEKFVHRRLQGLLGLTS